MIPLMISLLFIFDSAYQYPKGAAMIHAAKAMSVSDATRAGIEAMWEEGLGRLMRASLQDRGVLALQTILLVCGCWYFTRLWARMGWHRMAVATGITMGVLLGCLVIYQVSVELPSGWVRRLSEPLMEMRRWLFWRGEL